MGQPASMAQAGESHAVHDHREVEFQHLEAYAKNNPGTSSISSAMRENPAICSIF